MSYAIVELRRWSSWFILGSLAFGWLPLARAQNPLPSLPTPNFPPIQVPAAAPTPAPGPAAAAAPTPNPATGRPTAAAPTSSPAPGRPTAAAPTPRPLTVEERLQKLEETNQSLLMQNQRLNQQLRGVTQQIRTAQGTNAADDPPQVEAPPTSETGGGAGPEADVLRREPSTAGAYGGGELVAPPGGIEPPPPGGGPVAAPPTSESFGGAGPAADVLRTEPSTAGAYGGGDLVSTDPRDTAGLRMSPRVGRKFLNNGLWFISPNKNFQFHIGGRAQFDAAYFHAGNQVQFGQNGIGKLRDGVDARRMRFRMEGFMYEQLLFVLEMDFVNTTIPNVPSQVNGERITSVANTPAVNVPVPLDIWVGFRRLPYIGNLRIGYQKEPYGFERLTSSRYLNFMERSFNQDAFYSPFSNGFSPGIQAFNTWGNLSGTWAVGVFRNITNGFAYDVGGGNTAVTQRLTWVPIYEDEGREVVHFGISGRESGYDNGRWRHRVRGPERGGPPTVWPNYAFTPIFAGSGGQENVNLEFVSVLGPWTIDAEYNFNFNQNAFLPGRPSVGTLFYSGGYVEVLYFLTGENRTYIRESGVYDRVVPIRNAYLERTKQRLERGPGAWQVGIRYNYLNLNDKGIDGGVLNDITLGLNWFLNPNAKIQWNYSITNRNSPGGLSNGTIQGFGMRFAMDF